MTFHPEVMPDAQQEALRQLGPMTRDLGFHLAGGTALAIQIGHRRSVDFDWFSASVIDPMGLAEDLRRSGIPFEVSDVQDGTLHGSAYGVKLSFLQYRYAALSSPIEWPEYGIDLATLEDLTCMKLSAVGGRGEKKDFIDIFALGRERFTVKEMLELYRQKYGVTDIAHTLFALTYFDDAEGEEAPEMLWAVEWSEVRRTIEGWVRAYAGSEAPPRTDE